MKRLYSLKLNLMILLFLITSSNLFSQINVTLPEITGSKNATGTFSILIDDISGLNVTAYQFSLYYDKSVLYITGVTTNGTIMAGKSNPTINADTAKSKLNVAWASAGSLSGGGKLLNIQYKLRNSGRSTLTFVNPTTQVNTFILNGGSPASITDTGSVTVPQISVNVEDAEASVGDTISIRLITTELLESDNIMSYDFNASYDTSIIKVIDADIDSTLSEGGLVVINNDTLNGNLGFALASATKLVGTGLLLKIKAEVLRKGTTDFDFNNFQFNTGLPIVFAFGGTLVVGNTAPTFIAIQDTTIAEGDTIGVFITAEDVDGDTLEYNVEGIPPGANFDPITGEFTWSPSFNQAGEYDLEFYVSDGFLSDTLQWKVTVVNFNHTPTLELSPAGPYTVDEGETLEISLVGADEDEGDTLTYSAIGLPDGADLDSLTGAFSWTPDFDQAGEYSLTFIVLDLLGDSASVDTVITVNDVNQTPLWVTELPDTTIREGELFTFTYEAEDLDGDDITYIKVEPTPAGVTLNTSTGVISWTPAFYTLGDYQIVIKATDGVDTITTVSAVNVIPAVSVEEEELLPKEFSLSPNYPNPFNPSTTIKFGLPHDSKVVLKVYTVVGQEINTLVNEVKSAGYHTINFDASNLPSGIYLYQIRADNYTKTMKMMLIK